MLTMGLFYGILLQITLTHQKICCGNNYQDSSLILKVNFYF